MSLLIYGAAPLVGIHCAYFPNDVEDFDRALTILKSGKNLEKAVTLLSLLYEKDKSDKHHAHLLCAKAALLVEEKLRQQPPTIPPDQTTQAKSLTMELVAFKKSVSENRESSKEKSGYLNLASWSMVLVLRATTKNPECADLQKALREEIVTTAKESAESYSHHTQLKESGDILLSSVETDSTDYKDLPGMMASSSRQKKTVNEALALLDIAAPKQADAAAIWLYLARMKQRAYTSAEKTRDTTRFKKAADADNHNSYFALCYSAFAVTSRVPIVELTKLSESERDPILEYFFKGVNLRSVKPVDYAKTCPRFLKPYFPDIVISSPIDILSSAMIYTDLCNEYIQKGDFRAAIRLSDSMFDIAMQVPGIPEDAKNIGDAIERSVGTPRGFFLSIGAVARSIAGSGAGISVSDKMALCAGLKRRPTQDAKAP